MKALKAFIKPFEAPQKKSENNKLNFFFLFGIGRVRVKGKTLLNS